MELLLCTGQRVNLFAILRIRKRCEHRVIDLEIGATKPIQGAEFVDVNLGEIVPKIFGIGVDAFCPPGSSPSRATCSVRGSKI